MGRRKKNKNRRNETRAPNDPKCAPNAPKTKMLESLLVQFDVPNPARTPIVTKYGDTELHRIVRIGTLESLRKYLSIFPDHVDLGDPNFSEFVTPLCSAIITGNMAAVEILVQFGAQVNLRCWGVNRFGQIYSTTPLHVAVRCKKFEISNYFIKMGASVDEQEEPNGYTPLHLAIASGFDLIAPLLVHEANADPNIASSEDLWNYPLHKATLQRDYRMILLLLRSSKSNPNIADNNDGMTALHLAVMEQLIDAVKLIVYNNGDPNSQLKSGHTPLDLASFPGADPEIAEFLVSVGGKRNNMEDYNQLVFLVHDLNQLRLSLDAGSNVNCRVLQGETMLHHAIKEDEFEVARLLIERGANVNAQDHRGMSPLHYAAGCSDVKWLQLLIDHGADVYATDHVGRAPLHRAAELGRESPCRFLIKNSPDALIQLCPRGSPLICAINGGNVDAVKAFIEAGVPINTTITFQGCEGFTALACACMCNNPEMIKMLIDAKANVNAIMRKGKALTFPIYLVPTGNDEFLESLVIMIEAGAFFDVDIRQPELRRKNTPRHTRLFTLEELIRATDQQRELKVYQNTAKLFKAIRQEDLSAVEKLVSDDCLVNCCSITYDTPLTLASYLGSIPIVEYLLKNGAKVYPPFEMRTSPLHYAAKYNRQDVAVRLIKSGARISYLGGGVTALEAAMQAGHPGMINLLVFVGKYLLESGKKTWSPIQKFRSDPVVMKILDEMGDKRPSKRLLKALFGPA